MGDLSPAMVEALRNIRSVVMKDGRINAQNPAHTEARIEHGDGWVSRFWAYIHTTTASALVKRGLVEGRGYCTGKLRGSDWESRLDFLRLTDKGREVLASLEENTDG